VAELSDGFVAVCVGYRSGVAGVVVVENELPAEDAFKRDCDHDCEIGNEKLGY